MVRCCEADSAGGAGEDYDGGGSGHFGECWGRVCIVRQRLLDGARCGMGK